METQTARGENETIETTMGDLIEALTQIALDATRTQNEAYTLTSLAITDLLRKSGKDCAALRDSIDPQ